MKLWILVLVLLPSLSRAEATKPKECALIENRSHGFIKCQYQNSSAQWQLFYMPTAYGKVKESGKHQEMLLSLCVVKGKEILEVSYGFLSKKERKVNCNKVLTMDDVLRQAIP